MTDSACSSRQTTDEASLPVSGSKYTNMDNETTNCVLALSCSWLHISPLLYNNLTDLGSWWPSGFCNRNWFLWKDSTLKTLMSACQCSTASHYDSWRQKDLLLGASWLTDEDLWRRWRADEDHQHHSKLRGALAFPRGIFISRRDPPFPSFVYHKFLKIVCGRV